MLINTLSKVVMRAGWIGCAAWCCSCGQSDQTSRIPGAGAGMEGDASAGASAAGGALFGGGGTGATSSGAGGTDFGEDDSGASGDPDPEGTCVTETAEARPIPLDITLLVDNSFSMDFELRWQYVRGALATFVRNPRFADLSMALQFFPLRAQCSVDAYADPAIPMIELQAARSSFQDVLEGRRMQGGTPIVQALQGTGRYATEWAMAHPEHKSVIVLATDGVPDSTCSASSFESPNDLENAADVARSLANQTPEVPVFVVGVGEELQSLDTIAQAGGTSRAILVEDGASAQASFLSALEQIRRQSIACEYIIPEPESGNIDYDAVNVRLSQGSKASTFYYVANPDDCELEPDAAWYYDDPEAPTKVLLCPETCSRVTQSDDSRLDLAYGCERVDLIR